MTKSERIEKWLAVLTLAFACAYCAWQWLEQIHPTHLKKHGRKMRSCFRQGYDFIRYFFWMLCIF